MVKSFVPVMFDAEYESQQRTVAVSMKPAIGKELFAVQALDDSQNAGAFKVQFEAERFIHAKIREFTVRSSGRFNSANDWDVHRARVDLAADGDLLHLIDESEPLRRRLVAEAFSYKKDMHLSIPKGIREYVVAQLLRDSKGADLSSSECFSLVGSSIK